jgi:hypothetical protein
MAESLSRREALGLGVVATLGGVVPGVAAAAAGAPASAATPAVLAPIPRRTEPGPGRDGLLRYLRMRLAPGLAPVMWIYSGVLLVKPEGEVARPVTRIEGMSYTWATARPDGSFDWELEEIGYYCGLDDGRPLEEFVNPFTGARIRAVHYRSPQKLRFTPEGILPPQPPPPGGEFRGEITTLAQVGDTLAMTEDLYVRVPATPARDGKPGRGPRVFASLATFTCRRAELDRADDQWIDCNFTYTTMNTFSGWLGMDGIPGVQSMRLASNKRRERDLAAVPVWLRERIAGDHPGFLRG